MRLSELSARSGVSVATVKYYLREGLLAPGTPVTARQSDYGEEHLRRLRLVRALLTVGGMTVQQARDVLAVADDPAFGWHERVGIATYMLGPRVEPPEEGAPERELWDEVAAEVRALLTELDWRVYDEAPALAALVRAITSVRSLGYRGEMADIRRYALALHPIAEEEVAVIDGYPVLEEAIEATVAYTTLYEPILLALRRLAHEDASARRHEGGPGGAEEGGRPTATA
ncbi:MerR family transcriptional regulator [Streptomyces roseicoloratus]|uniref:MerR family transcriptional regulator n=1 Tax=Streptomyces roseicoloratus TaxID=2508722 RepID=A0ABY9RPD3_9ACTN|nr:MerR family transcriptional regulator [Streptomyces roseicoloratus]WMX44046.1 MerR family transcriptional regulator [Streptomyces roseicoloratus]